MNIPPNDTARKTTVELEATIVEYDDAPNECTIAPTDVSDVDRMSTWISAQEGSYVELADVN